MQLKISHVTRYRYDAPAWDSFNQLRLRPADDYRQTLHAFELTVRPRAELRSHRDRHDTRVETYPVPYPLEVSARNLAGLRQRFFEFLAPCERVPLDRDWHEQIGAARLTPDLGALAHVEALNRAVHQRFAYVPAATGVDTTLAEFVATDPTNASRLLGSEGSHAWVEAFLPGNGWVGFDPTNGCRVGEAHVKIGVGRDYDEVSPVTGWRRGGGMGVLEVEVQVRFPDGAAVTDLRRERGKSGSSSRYSATARGSGAVRWRLRNASYADIDFSNAIIRCASRPSATGPSSGRRLRPISVRMT